MDLQREGVYPKWPDVLPGARHVIITAIGPPGPNNASIEALSLTDGTRTVLVKGGTFGRYRGGHLVFMNQGTLFAIPFDVDRLSTRGTAVPVLTNVSHARHPFRICAVRHRAQWNIGGPAEPRECAARGFLDRYSGPGMSSLF